MITKSYITIALCLLLTPFCAQANTKHLQSAINGKHRTPAYVERDRYRNPLKTLQLFDIQPHHTVVEIWPSGGWYTEILAPYLKKDGLLIAAHYASDDTQASYRPTRRADFEKKMSAKKSVYGKVKITSLMFDENEGKLLKNAATPNSADRVVTFRAAHGMYFRNTLSPAFAHFFEILKPGGKLGFVQHQADDDQDWMSKNIGYIGRNYIIAEALRAGFTLESEGYFNRNPLDHKRHDNGVWQLPPALRGSPTEEDKASYRAVGESDRMTLVFTKP